VLLGVAGQHYGVPIEALREILPPRPFTPLPGSAACVCGLINLRGRIITTLDLGVRLGLEACASHGDHRIVVLDHGPTLVGLIVEEVVRIVRGEQSEITLPSGGFRMPGHAAHYLRGIGSIEEYEFAVLDPGELFRAILL
jgi:purine-binding chemotaxis protein CheW